MICMISPHLLLILPPFSNNLPHFLSLSRFIPVFSPFCCSPAPPLSALAPAVPLLTLGSSAGGGVAPCALLSVCVTPVSTRTRPSLCPAPAGAPSPLHVLVPVLPRHRGPGVPSIHGSTHNPCTLASVGHGCHLVTLFNPRRIFADWWKSLTRVFTGETDTPTTDTQRERHQLVSKEDTAHPWTLAQLLSVCSQPAGLGLILRHRHRLHS